MKKTLLLLLLILIMTTATAFAAVSIDSNSGIEVNITEEANDIVRATVYVLPTFTTTGISIALNYVDTVMNPCTEAGVTIPASTTYKESTIAGSTDPYITKLATLTDIAHYCELSSATTKYVKFSFTSLLPEASYYVNSKTAIYDVTFKKVAGATISASSLTWWVKTSLPPQMPTITNGTNQTVYSGTGSQPEVFRITYTAPSGASYIVSEDGTTTVYNLELITEPLVAVGLTTYTVTYDTNGGNSIADEVPATTIPATLPTPVKSGYYFAGWYTDSNLTISAVAGSSISADTTLYAKWFEIIVNPPAAADAGIEYNIPAKVRNAQGEIVDGIIPTALVVNVRCAVPPTVTETNIRDIGFGVIFGGIKFKSLATWEGLNAAGGRYIIRLVDPIDLLKGKTYKVKTYWGNYISTEEISITIN